MRRGSCFILDAEGGYIVAQQTLDFQRGKEAALCTRQILAVLSTQVRHCCLRKGAVAGEGIVHACLTALRTPENVVRWDIGTNDRDGHSSRKLKGNAKCFPHFRPLARGRGSDRATLPRCTTLTVVVRKACLVLLLPAVVVGIVFPSTATAPPSAPASACGSRSTRCPTLCLRLSFLALFVLFLAISLAYN